MPTISFLNLSIMLFPLSFVIYFYYRYTNDKKEIILATIRMILQLTLVGYILIFIFKTKNILIGFSILIFMVIVSTTIVIKTTKDKSFKNYLFIFISIFLSSFIHLFLVILVLNLDTLYEPRFIIPLAGIIIPSTMNRIALAIERFEREFCIDKNLERARKVSFKAAMIPRINMFLAVGFVAIPGMMTGQILLGVDPLIAVRYQIMTMIASISSGAMALIFYYMFILNKIKNTKK